MFVKWPCNVPSIHSLEKDFLRASVPITTHRHVRGHTEPPPVSHCGPTGAEPDLTGTCLICSPEWAENAEEVSCRAVAIGVCRCTRLAPWGAVGGPKAGWHYCQVLLNLHLEIRQLEFTDKEKRGGDPHLCTWETGECLACTGLVCTSDGTLFLPSQ